MNELGPSTLSTEPRAARVHDTWQDVGEGIFGALWIVLNLVTPFLRGARAHWGTTKEDAAREHPGDHHIPQPTWQWTHAVRIAASPSEVWPWVAQLGQGKAGFYSYQFLENLAGCEIQNAARVHAEWQSPKAGEALYLHPKGPPLTVTKALPGSALIATAGIDPADGALAADSLREAGHVAVSWAFLLEPAPGGETVLKSRYRCACSKDLRTRLTFGASLIEPIGFAMDRRMLLQIKKLAEFPSYSGAGAGAAGS